MTEAEFKPIWTSLLHRHPQHAERLTDPDWDDWLTKLSPFEPATVETALREWYSGVWGQDRRRFPELTVIRNFCFRLAAPQPEQPEVERDTEATETYCRKHGLPIDVPEGEEAKEAYRQAHINHCKEKLKLIGSKKAGA